MYVQLISQKFVTLNRNLIEVWLEYNRGVYKFKIAKNHAILVMMEIPDTENSSDTPIKDNEDLSNKFAEMLPHLQSVIKIIEEKP